MSKKTTQQTNHIVNKKVQHISNKRSTVLQLESEKLRTKQDLYLPKMRYLNKCQRTPKGQTKMSNPVKLAAQGTKEEEKQKKNNTEKLAAQGTQDEEKQKKNIPEKLAAQGTIKVITKLPNSEQSYKGKVKTHNYINRQNQSTTGKL